MIRTEPIAPRQFLRVREVVALTKRGRTSIYMDMAAGRFPKPVKIGPKAVAWDSEAIARWQAERMAQCRDAATAAE